MKTYLKILDENMMEDGIRYEIGKRYKLPSEEIKLLKDVTDLFEYEFNFKLNKYENEITDRIFNVKINKKKNYFIIKNEVDYKKTINSLYDDNFCNNLDEYLYISENLFLITFIAIKFNKKKYIKYLKKIYEKFDEKFRKNLLNLMKEKDIMEMNFYELENFEEIADIISNKYISDDLFKKLKEGPDLSHIKFKQGIKIIFLDELIKEKSFQIDLNIAKCGYDKHLDYLINLNQRDETILSVLKNERKKDIDFIINNYHLYSDDIFVKILEIGDFYQLQSLYQKVKDKFSEQFKDVVKASINKKHLFHKEKIRFHYVFQEDSHSFLKISYNSIKFNEKPYFLIDYLKFTKNKKGFCTYLNETNSFMGKLYNKWKITCLRDLTDTEYSELQEDIKKLKEDYNYIYTNEFSSYFRKFSIDEIRNLSKRPIKTIN